MNDIEKVTNILSKKVNVSGLKPNDSLMDLGLDSLDLVETMLEIEDAFNIEFSSEEISELKTLQNVIDLIAKKTK